MSAHTPSRSVAWLVTLDGKWLTTVFYTPECDAEYVRQSLIEHDGYPSGIVVREEHAK